MSKDFKSVIDHVEFTLLNHRDDLTREEILSLLNVVNSQYRTPAELNLLIHDYNSDFVIFSEVLDAYRKKGVKNVLEFTFYEFCKLEQFVPVSTTSQKVFLHCIEKFNGLPYNVEYIACRIAFENSKCRALRKFFGLPVSDEDPDSDVSKMKKDYEEKITFLNKLIDKNRDQLSDYLVEINHLKEKIKLLEDSQLSIIESKSKDLKFEIETLKTKNSNLEVALNSKELEFNLLSKQLEKQTVRNEELKAKYRRLNQKLNNTRNEIPECGFIIHESSMADIGESNMEMIWEYGYSQCKFTDKFLNIVSAKDLYKNFSAYISVLHGVENTITIEQFCKIFEEMFYKFGVRIFVYSDGDVYFNHITMRKCDNSFIIDEDKQTLTRYKKNLTEEKPKKKRGRPKKSTDDPAEVMANAVAKASKRKPRAKKVKV